MNETPQRTISAIFYVVLALGALATVGHFWNHAHHDEVDDPNVPHIAWLKTPDEAFELAREKQRLVLVDFTADWCSPCHEMDRTLFRDPEVVQFVSEHFVPLRLDVSAENAANAATLSRYSVVSLPQVVFATPDQKILDTPRIRGLVAKRQMMSVFAAVTAKP